MGFFSKAKKLMSTVVKHYDTAKGIATIINDNLPEDMKLGVPKIDEKDSVKENTSKLVTFVQTIQDFVEDLDDSLKEHLSAENYAKVAKVTAKVEDILPIVKTVTKGIAGIVGPVVTSVAKKIKNSKALKFLERKFGAIHSTAVLGAIHDSHVKRGCIDESHPGIMENESELDQVIASLEPVDGKDFHSEVQPLIAWFESQSKQKN